MGVTITEIKSLSIFMKFSLLLKRLIIERNRPSVSKIGSADSKISSFDLLSFFFRLSIFKNSEMFINWQWEKERGEGASEHPGRIVTEYNFLHIRYIKICIHRRKQEKAVWGTSGGTRKEYTVSFLPLSTLNFNDNKLFLFFYFDCRPNVGEWFRKCVAPSLKKRKGRHYCRLSTTTLFQKSSRCRTWASCKMYCMVAK